MSVVPEPPTLAPLTRAGKWLNAAGKKWRIKGLSYGPFRPNAAGQPFPEGDVLQADLKKIHGWGFNTLRLYDLPSPALLETAHSLGLRLLCGIPWTDHVDFLRDPALRRQIRETLVNAVQRLHGESCVIGFLVGNEIEKTLVRWMGPARVRDFLDDLIIAGKAAAPNHLFSYASYPSTEYLIPSQADFLAINLYLEDPANLRTYLRRLHNLAGDKPLVITEFGLDAAAQGQTMQKEVLRWFYQTCAQEAVAGSVWFSYTDEWFRGGEAITGWSFGLVDASRKDREAVQLLPTPPAPVVPEGQPLPRISVIVCTYNGIATLRACLQSLQNLRYPDYEVLLVDDGSTRDVIGIVRDFPVVRYLHQDHAGLSVARNLGAREATGEILAYTDDDCLVDEDWLAYLATAFDRPEWVAAGGPNVPPPPRNRTEAVVAAAPGAPAHVLLRDEEAEHLPGCNLAIRKAALLAIGGFRAHYEVAGDDVDICWRLREAGGKLRFVAGAMVWHHRRYTVSAYFRQQAGYGRAEALLMKDHPERFGRLGGARWLGGIYGDRAAVLPLVEGSIFHGPKGEGLFQGIYRQGVRCWLDWAGGLFWVAAFFIAVLFQWFLGAALVLCLSLILAACRLHHLTHPPFPLRFWESSLLLGLCWWQPVIREWQRLRGMVKLRARPTNEPGLLSKPSHLPAKLSFSLVEKAFWIEGDQDHQRMLFLDHLVLRLAQDRHSLRIDDGWRLFDLESGSQHTISTAYITVLEYHGRKQRLLRVRSLLRVRRSAALAILAMYGLVLAFLRFDTSLPLLILSIMSAYLLGLRLQFRIATHTRIMDAAKRADLTPMEG